MVEDAAGLEKSSKATQVKTAVQTAGPKRARRGRPRDPNVDVAIRQAAVDLLGEVDYARLTMDEGAGEQGDALRALAEQGGVSGRLATELSPLRPHDLKHTGVALLALAGVDPSIGPHLKLVKRSVQTLCAKVAAA